MDKIYELFNYEKSHNLKDGLITYTPNYEEINIRDAIVAMDQTNRVFTLGEPVTFKQKLELGGNIQCEWPLEPKGERNE